VKYPSGAQGFGLGDLIIIAKLSRQHNYRQIIIKGFKDF
jgi:hypothetical protein